MTPKASYLSYTFNVSPLEPGTEILIAELGYAGFESFTETDMGVIAYIQKEAWYEGILEGIQILDSDEFTIDFAIEDVEQINWNEAWEKNFQPIIVNSVCSVRAPFHEPFEGPYDLVIEPKMSFGTGHHETTYMMIQHILGQDFSGKTVLDMGCGTGVLAILSEKRGAKKIDAVDVDAWCYENSLENAERNGCKKISVYQGDSTILKGKTYDVVLANINRNVLLNDIRVYADCIKPSGQLFLSGFYARDIAAISEECFKNGFKLVEKIQRNDWVSLKFIL